MTIRSAWKLAGGLLIGVTICFSLIPLPSAQAPAILDKLVHGAVYALLMLWFVQITRRNRWAALALALTLLGISLELGQGAGGYRTFSYLDIAANTVGVALGWALALLGMSPILTRLETVLEIHNTRRGTP
ncbi:MAG: VanZ family protein [Gammaproteobacteria bacterium]